MRSEGVGAWCARQAYSWLLRCIAPLYLVKLWWRGRREPFYRCWITERFGLYRGTPPPDAGRYVWLHAVSLGETRAVRGLVEALRRLEPDLRLLLTHGTATGREAGAQLLRAGDCQCWLPADLPGAQQRFLKRYRPRLGLVMETEVWPNLMHAAAAAHVPVVLVNARLSARSQKGAQRVSALLGPAYAGFRLALAQTEADARRLRNVGVQHVDVVGNLKFDMTPPPELVDRGAAWKRRVYRQVVMAASTREGEEARLLASWRLRFGGATQGVSAAPVPILLIVPRHPQRFDEVARLVERKGLRLSRRSAWADSGPDSADAVADVWLGDTLGEMPAYYTLADVALLGGSFAPLGGQNLIEAAACGCPIIMGPHTFNFTQAAEKAEAAGVACRVRGWTQALTVVDQWLADPGSLQELHLKAQAFVAAHRGAGERMAQRIAALLDGPGPFPD